MAIQDEVWAGLAPVACAAARTIATEPPKPISTATTADITTEDRMARLHIGYNIYNWIQNWQPVNRQGSL